MSEKVSPMPEPLVLKIGQRRSDGLWVLFNPQRIVGVLSSRNEAREHRRLVLAVHKTNTRA